ncbi:MAG: 30S ribosomal protein S21 [bacterium]
MTGFEVKKGEPIEKVLRKFKSRLKRDGVIDEIKKREFYEKPSQRRREDLKNAVRRERSRKSHEW